MTGEKKVRPAALFFFGKQNGQRFKDRDVLVRGVITLALSVPRPSCFSRPGSIGRRDWTRTNDPHHVKVML